MKDGTVINRGPVIERGTATTCANRTPPLRRLHPLHHLYRFITPVILIAAACVSPFSRKLRRGLWARRGLNRRIAKLKAVRKIAHPIWFHVSSAGEFEQALGVIDALFAESPSVPIFLSYFSPSAEGAILRETARRDGKVPWAGADFSPFDIPFFVTRFLNALEPRLLVVINRELWPEMLLQAKRRGIGVKLIATFFQNPRKQLSHFALRYFDWVGAVDEASCDYVKGLGIPSKVVGDPRIERIVHRGISVPPWASFFNHKVLVLGSLWPEDFRELQGALAILSRNSWRLVFVPHEPTESFVNQLKNFSQKLGGTRRFSAFLRTPDESSHLIVDKVGPLLDLYGVATAAFVGGSFKRRVHNVSEAITRRIPVFTGPNISNSAEALQLSKTPALSILKSGDDLVSALNHALTEREIICAAADRFVSANMGVAQLLAESISKLPA